MNFQQLKSAGFVKGAVVVLGAIALMAFGNYLLSPSDPKTASIAPVQTAGVGQWAGSCNATPQTFTLSSSFSPINGGADCNMDWGIVEGPITLRGDGIEKTFDVAQRFSFRAKTWRCADKATCYVAAVFCPQKTAWNDSLKRCLLST